MASKRALIGNPHDLPGKWPAFPDKEPQGAGIVLRVANDSSGISTAPNGRFLRVHQLGRNCPPQASAPIETSLLPVRPHPI